MDLNLWNWSPIYSIGILLSIIELDLSPIGLQLNQFEWNRTDYAIKDRNRVKSNKMRHVDCNPWNWSPINSIGLLLSQFQWNWTYCVIKDRKRVKSNKTSHVDSNRWNWSSNIFNLIKIEYNWTWFESNWTPIDSISME